MSNVLLRYANLVLVTLFILSLLSFLLAYLFPGQAVENLTGLRFNDLTALQSSQIKYAVDDNMFVQYWHYMGELFAGNWGVSFSSGLPLYEDIGDYLPASIELSAYALFLSFFIGLPLGFLAALRHHKLTD
jgi:cationic peptide transport system permease protein